MNCPYCNLKDIKVIESRESSDSIRRRRECLKCSKRFTTYEKIQISSKIVIKNDFTKEPFSLDKLEKSVRIACTKRPVEKEGINKLILEVEKEVNSLNQPTIESKKIGEMVINKLRTLDDVAYIRFASVYKDFKDLSNFENELNQLLKK
ncbi:MAG: transcriptional regulator NrdR [Chloroflexi bacterium]|nr:transcriptional regulator NrdR [Chloroflexota bacterium]